MGHTTRRKPSAIRVFIPFIASAVFAAVHSHAGYITEQQPITGCQRIKYNPADVSGCNCKDNACTGYASATLIEYKIYEEVMPGEQGQRGCKSVATMIGTRGACMMAIDKNIEARFNECESLVWMDTLVCIAVAGSAPLSPAPMGCSIILFFGLSNCRNDWLLPRCSMLQCVQDPSFRLEISRPVATGFDTAIPPAPRQCFGKGI